MHFMSAFNSITRAGLKDCFLDDHDVLVYIVKENELGKAVGKKGFKVRMLEKATNRKIKILEFNPDLLTFVRNTIYPLKISNIEEKDGIVRMEAADSQNRGLLIGRAASNLRNFENIVKRYFNIKELRVE